MTQVGRKPVLPEGFHKEILEAVDGAMGGMEHPVILVAPLTRAPLSRRFQRLRPQIAIVARGEILPHV